MLMPVAQGDLGEACNLFKLREPPFEVAVDFPLRFEARFVLIESPAFWLISFNTVFASSQMVGFAETSSSSSSISDKAGVRGKRAF